jgi:membrane fusion protein (multidrug efflux system)
VTELRNIRIRYEQAQANQLSTEAAFEAAQANYNTSEMLSRDGRISKLEFDNAKTALKAAQGNLAGAQANTESAKLAYDNSRLVAPVSGYIAATDLGLGKVLSTGSVIVTIVDYTRLKLNTGVSESELFLIKKNQAVKIKSELTSVGLKGTVTGIGMKPLTGSSTYPIEIVADNQKGNYAPGMVVSASILARTYSDQIHIPLNVVLDDYGKKYVYLVDSDLKAKISYVTLGAIVNDQVIITEGLKEGDKLVTEGMEMLDEGASVEIKG